MASTVIPVVSAVLGTALALAVVVGARAAQQPQEEHRSAVFGGQPAEQQPLEKVFSAVFGGQPAEQEEDRSAVSGGQPAPATFGDYLEARQKWEGEQTAKSPQQSGGSSPLTSVDEDLDAVFGAQAQQPASSGGSSPLTSVDENLDAVFGAQAQQPASRAAEARAPTPGMGAVSSVAVHVPPRALKDRRLWVERQFPSWIAAVGGDGSYSFTSDDANVRHMAAAPLPETVLACAMGDFVNPQELMGALSTVWQEAGDTFKVAQTFKRVVQRQLVPMPTAGKLPVTITNTERKVTLTLSQEIGRADFGIVYMGMLSTTGLQTPVVVKVLRDDRGDKLMEEAMVQGMLWCTANDARLTPNPIPKLVLPMMMGTKPAIAMEYAGVTVRKWIDRATPRQMWFVLANLARALGVLGRAAGFTHADMHLNNLTVLPTADPQAITLDGVTFKEPLRVFIIDFGHACLTWPGGQLGPVETNHIAFCSNTEGAADLAYVLFSLAATANERKATDAAWDGTAHALVETVMGVIKSAGASGKFNVHSKRDLYHLTPHFWQPSDLPKNQHALMNAAHANTLTTPSYVMELCRRQLLGLSQGQ